MIASAYHELLDSAQWRKTSAGGPRPPFTATLVASALGRWVDPDLFGERPALWDSVNESFRVLRPGRTQGALALFENALG